MDYHVETIGEGLDWQHQAEDITLSKRSAAGALYWLPLLSQDPLYDKESDEALIFVIFYTNKFLDQKIYTENEFHDKIA